MESDSLYTPDVRRLLHSIKWPDGLRKMIVERMSAGDLYLQFILFRDNFSSFDGEDQLYTGMKVKEFMEKVRGMGIPIYLEVAKGDGHEETSRVRMGH